MNPKLRVVDDELVALVLRAQDGDPVAIEHLVHRWSPVATTITHAMVPDHAQAQDLAQDALLTAITRLRTLRSPDVADSWFHGIVHKTVLAHYRKRDRRRGLFERVMIALREGLLADAQPRWPDPLEDALVHRVLRQMPEELCAILILSDLVGHSRAEVASNLGIAPGTVASRLVRARELFRCLWDQYQRPGDR